MARQEIKTEIKTIKVKVHPKADAKVSTAKGMVNVRPYVRLVNGKPVLVAGYTYKR